MSEYFLYSDGGAQLNVRGAGAAVVVDVKTNDRFGAVAFLGACTNNEAEIAGALLGFSLLLHISQLQGEAGAQIGWTSDSEYVLKSATQYIRNWQRNGWKTADKKSVKNQGLWKAFLLLSEPFSIVPQHVRGHTGHLENEACDSISSWAQEYGASMLETEGEGIVPDVGTGVVDRWLLLDGRSFLGGLRNDQPTETQKLHLRHRFAELGINSLTTHVLGAGDGAAKRKNGSNGGRCRAQIRSKLEEAQLLAQQLPAGDELQSLLTASLQPLIEKLSKGS